MRVLDLGFANWQLRGTMQCPHCSVAFHDDAKKSVLTTSAQTRIRISDRTCPSCREVVVELYVEKHARNIGFQQKEQYFAFPKGVARAPLPSEVAVGYAEEYREAAACLGTSSRASAALSRRLLQRVLREKGGFKDKDLSTEIQLAIDSKALPEYIADALDAVRDQGAFARHPHKSTNAAAIAEVEAGEAEWSLTVLEVLFDFYFVQPAQLKKKQSALHAKLKDSGKPSVRKELHRG